LKIFKETTIGLV